MMHLEELDKIKNLNWAASKSYYQRVETQKQDAGMQHDFEMHVD